ncbi:MAG: family 10 glycosylhydrolase [Chitinophagaceae bacterium]
MSRLTAFRAFPVLVLMAMLALASCSKGGDGGTVTPPPPPPPPTPAWDPNAYRGVWITTTASTALDSRDNIKQTVLNCKTAGINHIFVVVYNNARTIYPSQVMNSVIGKPQLERFVGRDPLQEIIEEGRAAGIKVHAWFEYGFSSSFSANGGPIIAAKPNWAARDIGGLLVVKNGFDWLNAFHPEVQDYMISLIKEVVTNYNIDGVQGDDRLPACPSTSGYDPYTVALYKAETGQDPPSNDKETNWVNWRAKKLNAFLKRLRTEVKAIKPNLLFTMSPSPYPFSLNEYLQAWPTWVDSGYVDAVFPQVYRYDISAYNATLIQQKNAVNGNLSIVYPGVLVKSGSYVATDGFLTQMVQANRNNGYKGEAWFFYEGVKDKLPFFQGQYPFIK